MRNKIIGAVIAGCLCIAAANPAANAKVDPQNIKFEQAISFCDEAFRQFRKTGKEDYLKYGLSLLPTENMRSQVGLVCASYATGWLVRDKGLTEIT